MAECIRETGPRSGMAVVVLTDPKHLPVLVSEIDAAADGRPVAIAAINSSLQITLSGEEGEVERLMSLARAQRGVAAVQRMRRVAGAFHSPLMREAQRRFAVEASPLLRRARPSAIPVISNVTAEPVRPTAVCALAPSTRPRGWRGCFADRSSAGCAGTTRCAVSSRTGARASCRSGPETSSPPSSTPTQPRRTPFG